MSSDTFGRRMVERKSKNIKLSDDPPYYAIGTEVSARFRGAFCEARIKAVQLAVTCKLSCEDGIIELDVRLIRGFIKPGSQVEFVDPGTQQTRTGVIVSIKDCSLYTVDFDGGDERMLRRSQLCLKGGKHFLPDEALNSVPLTSPEQFNSPVKLAMSRSVRRNRRHQRQAASSHTKKGPASTSNGDRLTEKPCNKEMVNSSSSTPEAFPRRVWQVGDVVTVAEDSEHQADNQNNESTYYPGLVVVSDAFDGSIPAGHYVVCSFKTGRIDAVHEEKLREFTGYDDRAAAATPSCKPAVKRAITFLETSEVPTGWNRAKLLDIQSSEEAAEGTSKQPCPSSQEENSSSDEETDSSDSESEEDMEVKNLFVAHLYKFMDERGTPINKCPSLGGRDLDLHALYRKVQDLGGYTRVSHKNLWKVLLDQLRSKLGPSVTVKSLKSAYIKYLSNFDLFIRKIGYNFSAFGSSSSRTSARSKVALQKELRRNNQLASDKALVASKSRQRHSTPKGESTLLEESSPPQTIKEEDNEGSRAADVAAKGSASVSNEVSLQGRDEQSSSLRPLDLTVGQLVLVQYGNKSRKEAYKARVLQIHPKRRCLVHYAGWSSRYDEIVPFSRVLGVVEDEDLSRTETDVLSSRKVEGSDEAKLTESRRTRRLSSSPELTGGSLASDSSSCKSSLVAKAEPSLRKRSDSSLEKPSSSGEYSLTKPAGIKRSSTGEPVSRKSARKIAKLGTSMGKEPRDFPTSDRLAIPPEGQQDAGSGEMDSIGEAKAGIMSDESVEMDSTPSTKQFAEIGSPSSSSSPRIDAEVTSSSQTTSSPVANNVETESSLVEFEHVVDISPPEVHVAVQETFCRKEKEEEEKEGAAVFISYCVTVSAEPVAITVKACPSPPAPSCSLYYQSVIETVGIGQDGSHYEAKDVLIVLDNESLESSQCAGPSYSDWSDHENSLRVEVFGNDSSEVQGAARSSDDMDLATVNLQILEREVVADLEASGFVSESDAEDFPASFDSSMDVNAQIAWLEQAMSRTKKEYSELRKSILKLERRRRRTLGKKTPTTEQNSSDTAAGSSFDE